MASYDILGNIAIIKTEESGKIKTKSQKLIQAKKLLKQPSVKTVIEKASNVQGRLRKIKTKHIAGKKNLIAIYKENNCTFKLNVESCYFSPRLSNDRKEIAKKIKKSDKVLVMFAGVGPYPIVFYKLAKPKQITSIELSRECNKYQKENLRLNKIPKDKIEIIQGDVKKRITKDLGKFEVIMMARPNLKPTFLNQALIVSKKNTKIFYHGFCHKDKLPELKTSLIKEAKNLKRKIKIINTTKAGDIAPYKFRYRIEIKVLN
jgi:tRNA (guanine37-N1)-methyltransferase